ncbi:MAG: TRAP transporter substrate-binding protein DctP, partial [Rhodothalassiaceae bacterium]
IEDMQGLVIRTLDANTTELARRLGMTPVQLASPDVVPALAAGALDAVFTSTTTGAAQKYWEFLSHIHRTNHGWITNLMVINERALSRLAAPDRQRLLDLARALEPEFWKVSHADDLARLATLRAHGMTVVEPDAALAAAMQSVARPMWRDFAARVPDARPILDHFLVRTGRAPLAPAAPEAGA